jgi:hypothetical protein
MKGLQENPTGMDNKKTSPEAEQWGAFQRAGKPLKELAMLHDAALRSNFGEFLERRDEFIGLLYRAADYSVHKQLDTFTQYEWGALTLGLEPNHENPSLGPIPFGLVAESLAHRDPPSQQHEPYSQRLCSFDFIVELIESGHEAGRLPYMECGPMWISFLKEDLIEWSENKGLPVADELLDRGDGRKLSYKHHQTFWDAETTLRKKHERQPTEIEIWEALKAVADRSNAAIHSVYKSILKYREKAGGLESMMRKSVMEWLRKQRKSSGK